MSKLKSICYGIQLIQRAGAQLPEIVMERSFYRSLLMEKDVLEYMEIDFVNARPKKICGVPVRLVEDGVPPAASIESSMVSDWMNDTIPSLKPNLAPQRRPK